MNWYQQARCWVVGALIALIALEASGIWLTLLFVGLLIGAYWLWRRLPWKPA